MALCREGQEFNIYDSIQVEWFQRGYYSDCDNAVYGNTRKVLESWPSAPMQEKMIVKEDILIWYLL